MALFILVYLILSRTLYDEFVLLVALTLLPEGGELGALFPYEGRPEQSCFLSSNSIGSITDQILYLRSTDNITQNARHS